MANLINASALIKALNTEGRERVRPELITDCARKLNKFFVQEPTELLACTEAELAETFGSLNEVEAAALIATMPRPVPLKAARWDEIKLAITGTGIGNSVTSLVGIVLSEFHSFGKHKPLRALREMTWMKQYDVCDDLVPLPELKSIGELHSDSILRLARIRVDGLLREGIGFDAAGDHFEVAYDSSEDIICALSDRHVEMYWNRGSDEGSLFDLVSKSLSFDHHEGERVGPVRILCMDEWPLIDSIIRVIKLQITERSDYSDDLYIERILCRDIAEYEATQPKVKARSLSHPDPFFEFDTFLVHHAKAVPEESEQHELYKSLFGAAVMGDYDGLMNAFGLPREIAAACANLNFVDPVTELSAMEARYSAYGDNGNELTAIHAYCKAMNLI